MPELRKFDAAEFLDTQEDVTAFLAEAFETGDASFIAKAIGTVVRARGTTEVARETGLSRENLYRALSGETRVEFDTVMRVLGALGLELEPKQRAA
ncbi:putative addiction module antidote protein [Rhodoplanes elegans]|uniref:Putative addiction module antidote protein n=1 Tax=Rhodoplanes elegans TaxID=29408 RepID=A0A327KU45_9BRAD|nr:addiction module antidote protein [Rhodoplanes elegans]MBK5959672.1 putative addiction module antidote protein [Rhodoplanes elegans]RAI41777.1 putative addiction module antidote protein [Rhodoplanes elegans]